MDHRLTIVLVTSPVLSHPSTQLIDEVIASFELVSGLASCPLMIVADGVRLSTGRPRWNQGKVNEAALASYLQYLEALRSKYSPPGDGAEGCGLPGRRPGSRTTVLGPLKERVSFGHALLEALGHVDTEFVMVVQHDRIFAEALDLRQVLELFEAHGGKLRYLGFQTVPDYPTRAVSKFGKWARSGTLSETEPCLVPLLMWYDSTHVCRARQYAELIRREVRPGEFIESSYGDRLLWDIRSRQAEWSYDYHMDHFGLFLYHDPQIGLQRPIVKHVSGRNYRSREQRLQQGWPGERPTRRWGGGGEPEFG